MFWNFSIVIVITRSWRILEIGQRVSYCWARSCFSLSSLHSFTFFSPWFPQSFSIGFPCLLLFLIESLFFLAICSLFCLSLTPFTSLSLSRFLSLPLPHIVFFAFHLVAYCDFVIHQLSEREGEKRGKGRREGTIEMQVQRLPQLESNWNPNWTPTGTFNCSTMSPVVSTGSPSPFPLFARFFGDFFPSWLELIEPHGHIHRICIYRRCIYIYIYIMMGYLWMYTVFLWVCLAVIRQLCRQWNTYGK